MLGNLGQRQRTGRIDDHAAVIVDLDAGQRRDRRAGGDHDVLGGDDLVADLDRIGALERGIALEPVDLVLLEQEFDPAGQFLDRLGLLGMHLVEVEARARDIDAELGERARMRLLVQLGRVQHRLRRNAADVEAGAAKRLAPFGAGGLQPQLRRADRRDIAAGTGADDNEVVVEIGHSNIPYRSISRRVGSSIASLMRTRKVTASRPSIRRWS